MNTLDELKPPFYVCKAFAPDADSESLSIRIDSNLKDAEGHARAWVKKHCTDSLPLATIEFMAASPAGPIVVKSLAARWNPYANQPTFENWQWQAYEVKGGSCRDEYPCPLSGYVGGF